MDRGAWWAVVYRVAQSRTWQKWLRRSSRLFCTVNTLNNFTSHSLLLLFSCSVLSDSLWPQGLQHARLPCPSLSPRTCSNSCPFSQWCHPTIPSSVIPFSSCPQSFPTSRSSPVRQLFASGGQSVGASASATILQMNIQSWFPLGLTGLISLLLKGLSRVFSNTTFQKLMTTATFLNHKPFC